MSITKLAWNWASAHNTNPTTTTASGTPRRIITGLLTGTPTDEAALHPPPSTPNRR
jgi:hypothetical protein